jgi:serine/threonine-protein kinase
VTAQSTALHLGKYRLIIELAQGGMGCVYLAVAQGPAGFSKLSVIKELKPELLEEPGFLAMFLDEARLSARLNHPNVVQTNEVSVDAGRAWLAMEYLDGQSLVRLRARLTREKKLPLAVHLRVIAESCHGLHYAHELRDFDGTPLGVVHRDVSPHNVFVTYDGHVKILDFGVAKALGASHETTAGVMKGKVAYMAPEQVMGDPLDRRADVFSVGVMLWEAVAGKRMWDQLRVETIIARLMAGEIPSLAEAAPNAPPRLRALVDRAMARRPEDRFATIEMLRVELEACIAELGEAMSVRDLGRVMAEAFAPERAQVNEAVQGQLRMLQGGPVSIMTLPMTAMSGSFGAMQQLPTIAGPLEKQGGTGKTAASMATVASHPPPPQPAKVGSVAVIAILGVMLLVGSGIGIRQFALKGAGSQPSAEAPPPPVMDADVAPTTAIVPSSVPDAAPVVSTRATAQKQTPPPRRSADKRPAKPGDDVDVGY